jgi:hypothetical protein
MLRLGDTLVPLMFMSDGTRLLNFAGDKNQRPIYMAIGNHYSKICQMPAMHSVLIGSYMLIPLKNLIIHQKRLDERRQTNPEVLNDVVRQVLPPSTIKLNPSTESQ